MDGPEAGDITAGLPAADITVGISSEHSRGRGPDRSTVRDWKPRPAGRPVKIDPEHEVEPLRSRVLIESARKECETLLAQIRENEKTIARSRKLIARLDGQFCTDTLAWWAHPFRIKRMEGAMHDPKRYRSNVCDVKEGSTWPV
jgi:hypothetical protein